MPEENVQAARSAFEAFRRTFADGSEDLFGFLDPETEFLPLAAIVEGTRYHGHDGVRQWIDDIKRDWTIWEPMIEHVLDLGDDRVLVLGGWHAQGRRGSDADLDIQQGAWLLRFRNGKILRLETFTEREKAFEAAGLSE